MSRPRKIRRDAKLKELPVPQRVLIAGWLKEDGWQSCLQRMRSELQLSAGKSALYEALAYWETEAEFDAFEAMARAQAELESRGRGGMTADEMQEATDRNFIAIAAARKDTKLYTDLRYMRIADQSVKSQGRIAEAKLKQGAAKIAQKDRDLSLAERRVRLLEENQVKAKAALEVVKKTGGLSAEALQQIEEAARFL